MNPKEQSDAERQEYLEMHDLLDERDFEEEEEEEEEEDFNYLNTPLTI